MSFFEGASRFTVENSQMNDVQGNQFVLQDVTFNLYHPAGPQRSSSSRPQHRSFHPYSRHSRIMSGSKSQLCRSIRRVITIIMDERLPRQVYDELTALLVVVKCIDKAITITDQTRVGTTLADRYILSVRKCSESLGALLDSIVSAQEESSWRKFLHAISQLFTPSCHGQSALIMRDIQDVRHTFESFLAALAFDSSGMELVRGSPHAMAALEEFSQYLASRVPTIQHIQLQKIIVVDHLGRRLPIPLEFCFSYKIFRSIITNYCNDRAGSWYIRRGEYQIVDDENGKLIKADLFTRFIRPEAVVHMSIIIRQPSTSIQRSCVCPRCKHPNRPGSEWIQCFYCSCNFRTIDSAMITQSDSDDVSAAAQDVDNGQIVIAQEDPSNCSAEIALFCRISALTDDQEDPLRAALGEIGRKAMGGFSSSAGMTSRTLTTSGRLTLLEAVYNQVTYPDRALKIKIAAHLGMTARGVHVWFQNRRARAIRKAGTPGPKTTSSLKTPEGIEAAAGPHLPGTPFYTGDLRRVLPDI